MTRRIILLAAGLLAVVGLAWPGPLTASADQPEPQVVLGFQPQAQAGEAIAVAAYLVDPVGNPIMGEEITFTIASTFLNVDGPMEIGSATTDANGLALLPYAPRIGGERVVTARFAGNEVFAPARASEALLVTQGPNLYEEFSPLRIPGANIWMASAVLAVVWGVFLYICVLIWRIAFLGASGGALRDANRNGASHD